MFAAPINDMREALAAGTGGDLNFFPFAMMTGNTIGWLAYGYFTQDPFIISSNLPGFILSLWLNMGAAKIQYMEMKEKQTTTVAERNQVMQRWDADRVSEDTEENMARQRRRRQSTVGEEEEDGLFLTNETAASIEYLQMTPQETLLLRVLVFWACIITYTSWLYPSSGDPANMVGVIVNINLVVFYAAPLKSIQTVVTERNSASIHYETMVMNWVNTTFWCLYGMARRDVVILLPNATGLMLGIAQGVLCLLYPRQPNSGGAAARLSLHELESDLLPDSADSNPEEIVPESTTELTTTAKAQGKKATSHDTPEII
ncbi:Sugar transporter SWEET1 [Seminavis robusta]|uniref:Sugar transporter SWEET1 n=1 Tax=Seminavis robusta TaxID=568900 RepID=A0A9N8HH28_9STRA|nr:Sugar transporter SWEET1 [Seminavis robusta]|eukprot:Sro611_g175260.1 Sugar transporter SWEET1 (316) ;mRNA; f:9274-10498